MEQKLYNLKMKILKDKSINDDLKRELADEIFQIQQEIAINYTRSCETLPTKDEIAEKAKERALKFNSVNEIGYLRHKNSFELGAEFVKEHLEKQK